MRSPWADGTEAGAFVQCGRLRRAGTSLGFQLQSFLTLGINNVGTESLGESLHFTCVDFRSEVLELVSCISPPIPCQRSSKEILWIKFMASCP